MNICILTSTDTELSETASLQTKLASPTSEGAALGLNSFFPHSPREGTDSVKPSNIGSAIEDGAQLPQESMNTLQAIMGHFNNLNLESAMNEKELGFTATFKRPTRKFLLPGEESRAARLYVKDIELFSSLKGVRVVNATYGRISITLDDDTKETPNEEFNTTAVGDEQCTNASMSPLTISLKDDCVAAINEDSEALLALIISKYSLSPYVSVDETIRGHIALLTRQEGSFFAGTEQQAATLSRDDFIFLSSLNGIRWIEFCCGMILIGFENLETAGNQAILNLALNRDSGLGKSINLKQAKELIDNISSKIFEAEIGLPLIYKTIDWGRPRGQGKRAGSMIKGGMATILGRKSYEGLDISAFPELQKDRVWTEQLPHYVKARLYGCNHLEAKYYAIRGVETNG